MAASTRRGLTALSMLLYFSVACRTSRGVGAQVRSDVVYARAEAEDYVRLIKHNFNPGDLEFRQAEFLYGRLRGSYECWVEGAVDAIQSRRNPANELQFLGCIKDAPERRADFEAHVRQSLTSPRARPQANSSLTLPDAARIIKGLERGIDILKFFDQFAETWQKLYERYKKADAAERQLQIDELQKLRWRKFADVQ